MNSLLFLAYLLGCVCAYATYGAYERMYYYYAYLIDADINGQPSKVAKGCNKNRKCTFDEFLKFINLVTPTTSITTAERPDVHKTATALVDAGYTGAYDGRKLWTGVEKNGVAALFTQSSIWLEAMHGAGKVKPELLGPLRDSMQLVSFYRNYEGSESMKATLRLKFPGIDIREIERAAVMDGGKEFDKQKFIDPLPTIKANPGIPDLKKQIIALRDSDPTHTANVQESKAARLRIGCS